LAKNLIDIYEAKEILLRVWRERAE
jgi:hypothetical protein